MIQIDLITGFLGSGKTTFLRHYAQYLLGQGLHIGIVENDFGAVNVDRLLLQDLESDACEGACEIEQIVGGNVAADWQRRFKAKLIALSMRGVQRVLVEPSGLYDTDAFFDVLYEEPIATLYETGNIFAVVDPAALTRLAPQAESMLVSQLACCGQVVLSRATPAMATPAAAALNALLQKYDCQRDMTPCVLAKPWAELTPQDCQRLLHCGHQRAAYRAVHGDANKSFASLYFLDLDVPAESIAPCVQGLFGLAGAGQVFRVKGFFETAPGCWQEVNATPGHCEQKPLPLGQKVLLVIGQELNREIIEAHLKKFAAQQP